MVQAAAARQPNPVRSSASPAHPRRWIRPPAAPDPATPRRLHTKTGTQVTPGEFVEVWLAVTNHTDVAHYLNADDQRLRAGGTAYYVDVEATIAADQGPEIGLREKIGPGSTERILLVFNVAQSVRPTAVEVHGDPEPPGTLLALPGH
jgi:hypothetical protein